MAGALVTVRNMFTESNRPFTAGEICRTHLALKPNEISVALSYLLKQRYVTRELIPSTHRMGRKKVWSYTYHPDRVPLISEAS